MTLQSLMSRLGLTFFVSMAAINFAVARMETDLSNSGSPASCEIFERSGAIPESTVTLLAPAMGTNFVWAELQRSNADQYRLNIETRAGLESFSFSSSANKFISKSGLIIFCRR